MEWRDIRTTFPVGLWAAFSLYIFYFVPIKSWMMFTPIETTLGALLLHQASSALLFYNGSVLGASGLLRDLLNGASKANVSFFSGMAIGMLMLRLIFPAFIPRYPVVDITLPAILGTICLGLMTGWGTKRCNGCTSGHMLCGLSRLSGRSAMAVLTFFPTAYLTYQLFRPEILIVDCSPSKPCYLPIHPSWQTTTQLVGLAVTSTLALHAVPQAVKAVTGDPGKARLITQFLTGYVFGLGLLVSGMADPCKVRSFFAITPSTTYTWDPSLSLVFFFGVLPNILWNKVHGFIKPPAFNTSYNLPTKTWRNTDWRFVVGAATFGVSWGLSGVCPGPAVLRSLMQPLWGLWWLTGFWLGGWIA